MCGFSGIVGKSSSIELEEIESITQALSHRGPDGKGVYINDNIAIGHRRLAIIDLEAGKQPMQNENGSLIITYNGELYNFIELKKTLSQKGYRFRTHSDTEVILKAYEAWGKRCVEKFRGMFAFAIVDNRNKEIFLARDPLGIKPLVYYSDSKRFAFASEIQALKKLDGFIDEKDLLALDQYLTYQYIPAPRTIYRKIKKLLPGHFMVVGFDGSVKNIKPYWDFSFRPKPYKSKQYWIDRLHETILQSVKLHTQSDVDFGAFLSGGIDSTVIIKYMTQVLEQPVKTYNIGFKESEFDETQYATQVAKKYNTLHTSYVVEEDALSILPDLVKHYGEPFGDFSAVPTYFVSKIAGENVKMVLSGDGGDELFAGYSTYPWWLRYAENNPIYFKNNRIKTFYPLANQLFPHRYPTLASPVDQIANYLNVKTRMPYYIRENLWRPEFRYVMDIPYENIMKYEEHFKKQATLSRAQFFDIMTFLPGDILTKVDTASMIHSLEVRTPLIDKVLFETAAGIPPALLMDNYSEDHWQGKRILKELLKDDFDDSFINRPKRGFEIPLNKWLGGKHSIEISNRLTQSGSPLQSFFLTENLKEILAGNDYYMIWLLLVLHEWLEQNETLS